jgi:hypothetical protein
MSQSTASRQSAEAWAAEILLQAHAIAKCHDHGFMRLRFDHTSLEHAHALAAAHPFPGMDEAQSAQILDDCLDGIGDACPGCGPD